MRALGRIKRVAKSQSGFTIAEVFIAAMLMILASMGMLSLFNSSVQLSGITKEQRDMELFARTVSERVRALPFYKPYAGENADIDDYFWGTADEHGTSITHNSWGTPDTTPYNPYVDCDLITDPRFDCQVKMAYVKDNLTTGNMKSDWIPKAGESQQTKDKPLGTDNKPFNVIKYEVKVTWKVEVEHSYKGKPYTYTSLVTSTQVQANLGVTAMINIDPNAAKWGTEGANSNTAPHTVSALQIRITGYGFKPTGNVATLMKVGVADMPVNNLTYVDSGTLTGTVDLNTGGSAAAPWQPRRDPGKWTVRVAEGVAFAYGYDTFTVEFPRPVISSASPPAPSSGKDSDSALAITATGNYVLNLGPGTDPYIAYCGATIRLVKDDNPDMVIYASDDVPITYGTAGGYDGSINTVTATFDLTNQTVGNYFVEIINCKDNQVEISDGNTVSADNGLCKFMISTAVPTPLKIYVTGSSGNEVYVASGEKRPFAYRNREYQYKLKVEGTDLGSVNTVKIGINGDPAMGTSPDFVASATDIVTSPDSSYLTCVADFKNVPDSLAVSNTTYSWWVYVENSVSGSKGNLTDCFMIRKVRPILYMNAQPSSTLYHNTAPAGSTPNVTLYGECFESAAYNIKYMPGAYSWNSPANPANAYVVGISDGGMTKGSPTNKATTWSTQLNLLHCLNGANSIWVESNDAGYATDNGFTSTEPRTYSYSVAVSLAPGATLNNQQTGAVTITNRFQDWWGTGKPGWTSAWRGPTANTEGASVANAQRSNVEEYFYWNIIFPVWVNHDEYGGAAFTLKGQGFVDQAAGSSSVAVLRMNGTSIASGNFSVVNPATRAAALVDRVNKYVTLSTTEWQMPNVETSGRITLGTTTYPDRFYIRQVLENTDT